MPFIKNVAFFGFADVKPKDELYKQAFQVAKTLAVKGFTIVNGGGPGVMDASTQGAESVGGETIAVTFYPKSAPGFEGRYIKNIVDQEIKTANYIERLLKLLEHGDIYIIFKGGTGTLSEFSAAWCLARLYYGVHKPFILYGEFWKDVIKCIKHNFFLRGNEEAIFRIVSSPMAAVRAIEEFEKEFMHRFKKLVASKTEQPFIEGNLRSKKQG